MLMLATLPKTYGKCASPPKSNCCNTISSDVKVREPVSIQQDTMLENPALLATRARYDNESKHQDQRVVGR
jgi:hypothetical protein